MSTTTCTHDAATVFGDFRAALGVQGIALAPPPNAAEREQFSRDYVARAKREAAADRWRHECPPEYRESDWSRPELAPYRPIIDRVLGYKLGPKGILATGRTGRGKTRAMWQLMRRLACDEGVDCRYYHAAQWFFELGQWVNYGRDEARGWVEAVAARPIVFLDDLGQEAVMQSRQDWATGWFFRFLDLRVGRGLPLFVTTNLHAADLVAHAGSRADIRGDPLVRRLLDLSDPIVFETPAKRA